jgi:phage portal protein BeeE
MGVLATLRAGLQTETRAGLVQLVETLGRDPVEPIENDYTSFVQRGLKDNGIVFAAVAARLFLFAQGKLGLRNIRTSETRDLPPRAANVVRRPWPNGSQSELLSRIEQDQSMGGNYYLYQAAPDRWQRLRPDWVDIVLDPRGQELAGYLYHQGGRHLQNPRVILPEEMAHGSPIPDPLAAFRGMSWVTAVVREVLGDTAMNTHKLKFFENAATPNLLLRFMQTLSDPVRDRLENTLKTRHIGTSNAYKTLVLEEGGDATVIGSNLQEAGMVIVQAAGENRIAVASGVPSVVLGIKEGAEQATYNNYASALEHFANFPIQHYWNHAADTLESLVPIPQGWELFYETSHIPALQRDQKLDAETLETQAVTMRELLDAGFEADSVIEAVTSGDLTLLEHTGLVSDALDTASEPTGESEEGDEEGTLAFLTA